MNLKLSQNEKFNFKVSDLRRKTQNIRTELYSIIRQNFQAIMVIISRGGQQVGREGRRERRQEEQPHCL